MPVAGPWNQSRSEEIIASPDVRAIVDGGDLPNMSIGQMSDVDGTVVPADGQSLTFNSATGKYEPVTVAPPGGGLLQPDEPYIVGPVEEASQQIALASVPTAGTLMISINGLDQETPGDYTLVGAVVTFSPPAIYQGDKVIGKYQ